MDTTDSAALLRELTDAEGRKIFQEGFQTQTLLDQLSTDTSDREPAPLLDPTAVPMRATGKRPAKGDSRSLMFARFVYVAKIPKRYNPWGKRAPFMPRTFGNTSYGCCTRASQAVMAMRLERVETRGNLLVTDAELLRVYFDMTARRYGGGDTGAYELDALSEWRNPDTTFRDTKGHPICAAAFTKINHGSIDEVKAAIAVSGKWGIKLCLALPRAWSGIGPEGGTWDVPRDPEGKPAPLTGDWEPYTWGGHSLYANRYDETGIVMPQTWYEGLGLPRDQWPKDEQVMTWDALAAYCDEAYWIMDAVDVWRHKAVDAAMAKMGAHVEVDAILKAVNKVSRTRFNPKTGKVSRAA